MGAAPLVRVVRSGVEESVHLGHVAVCDVDGHLLASAGDPRRPFYLRSCAKPIQAAVSLAAIGRDLLDDVVAVMCASHNGEPVHVRTVRKVLRLAGLDERALRTPPGLPLDEAAARRVRVPSPLLHNCSGKHAGMLLASVAAGWPTETYRRRTHPLQRRVSSTMRAVAQGDPTVGVDGCGVPVHALPLVAIATAYARLSSPDRYGALAPSIERAVGAMRAAPYVVGGRDRLDTGVMEATGHLVVKEGAEAMVCAVDLRAGIGIAVKVADGGERAVGPALASILEQLGSLTAGQRRALRPLTAPPVLGGGRPVGVVEAVVALRGGRSGSPGAAGLRRGRRTIGT